MAAPEFPGDSSPFDPNIAIMERICPSFVSVFYSLFMAPVLLLCLAGTIHGQAAADSVYTQHFRRSGEGWNAGDATLSVALPDGRTIWLFGDSHFNQTIGSDNLMPCLFQLRNCMVVQSAGDSPTFTTHYDAAQAGVRRTTFKYGADNQVNDFMWPAHGFFHNDTVYLFFQRWKDEAPAQAGLDFNGNMVARLSYPELALLGVDSLPFPLRYKLGKAVFPSADGWLYAYHARTDTVGNLQGERPCLSRSPLNALFQSWEHRSADGWTTDVSQMAALTSYFVSSSFSVFPHEGKYYLLTQQLFGLICGNGREIYLAEGDDPWGSFALRKLIYTIEDQFQGVYLATYNAQAHPGRINEQGLLVSYNVNDSNSPTCPAQCASANFRDADTYRPKFVRVPLADLRVGQMLEQADVFLLAGQSNAVGQGDAQQSDNPAPETAFQLNAQQAILYPLKDPAGYNDPLFGFQRANTGSLGPAFGKAYAESCGRIPILVSTAAANSSCHPAVNPGLNWSASGQLYNRSRLRLGAALSALRRTRPTGVIWLQGESDGGGIRNGLITAANYQAALADLISRFRADWGPDLPFYIVQTGANTDFPDDAGYEAVRAAQTAVAEADEHTYMVYDSTRHFPALGLMADAVHYNQQGLNRMGASIAPVVCATLTDADGDGANAYDDCNDQDPLQYPDQTWYADADDDSYSSGATLTQCLRPAGYKIAAELAASTEDCNDENPAIYPCAPEIFNNGIDEDCDGSDNPGPDACANWVQERLLLEQPDSLHCQLTLEGRLEALCPDAILAAAQLQWRVCTPNVMQFAEGLIQDLTLGPGMSLPFSTTFPLLQEGGCPDSAAVSVALSALEVELYTATQAAVAAPDWVVYPNPAQQPRMYIRGPLAACPLRGLRLLRADGYEAARISLSAVASPDDSTPQLVWLGDGLPKGAYWVALDTGCGWRVFRWVLV